MISVICSIIFAVNAGGVNILHQLDVEGVILNSNTSKYYVDFTKGIQKKKSEGITVIGEDYKRLVDADKCVKI